MIAWHFCPNHILDQARELGVKELRHPLLVATDALGQLRRLTIANPGCEGLDALVDRDLHVLLTQLFLCVTQMRLALLGDHSPGNAYLALDRRDGLTGDFAN